LNRQRDKTLSDSEVTEKDSYDGADGQGAQGPPPEVGRISAPKPSVCRAPPPATEVGGGSSWIPPRIRSRPSEPLTYGYPFPEASGSRVRAEMLRADADFTREEQSHDLTFAQRHAHAICWIRRVLGVFAEEACRLARSGAPAWPQSKIEPRVNEVVRQLALECESSKFVGGYKPLTQGGQVRAEIEVEIGKSSEWSQYRQRLLEVLDQRASLELPNATTGDLELGRTPHGDGGTAERSVDAPVGDRAVAQCTASGEIQPKRKRGAKPNYELASRVALIVTRVAPDGCWRSKLALDDICDELDTERIPCPRTWEPKHGFRNWWDCLNSDGARGRHLVIEAIKHHLKLAKDHSTEIFP